MIISDTRTVAEFMPELGALISQALQHDDGTATGRYLLRGEDVTVTLSEDQLRPQQGAPLEVHQEFADVQIVLRGIERYGYLAGTYSGAYATQEFGTRDIAFLDADTDCQYADLDPRQLAIFLPGTPHKPLCLAAEGCSSVRKAIIKIRRSALQEFFRIQ